jgi:cation transport ATPase
MITMQSKSLRSKISYIINFDFFQCKSDLSKVVAMMMLPILGTVILFGWGTTQLLSNKKREIYSWIALLIKFLLTAASWLLVIYKVIP